jgi:hypothetical protein
MVAELEMVGLRGMSRPVDVDHGGGVVWFGGEAIRGREEVRRRMCLDSERIDDALGGRRLQGERVGWMVSGLR